MGSPAEEVAVAVLKGLAAAVPTVAAWLFDVTKDRPDPFSRRVRDILPERSASRQVADELAGIHRTDDQENSP